MIVIHFLYIYLSTTTKKSVLFTRVTYNKSMSMNEKILKILASI